MNTKRFIVCIYLTQSRWSCFHTGTFTSQVMGCGLYSAGVNVGGGGPPQSSRIWVGHPPAAWAAAKTRGLHLLTSSLSVPLLLLPQLQASPILPALPTLNFHFACSSPSLCPLTASQLQVLAHIPSSEEALPLPPSPSPCCV